MRLRKLYLNIVFAEPHHVDEKKYCGTDYDPHPLPDVVKNSKMYTF
jgi:hypothetical protein